MIQNVGDKIRYLRDKAGYTQTYLAKKLGISRSAVNSWEMALSSPSLSNVVKMSEIFHVSIDYLLSSSERFLVDISNLTHEEREIVLKLINCLSEKNEEK